MELNNPQHRIYDGGFVLSYPDRTFSGTFDVAIPGPQYKGSGQVGWSANDIVMLSFDSGLIFGQTKNVWIDAKITTPFEGWRENGLNGGLFYENSFLLTNASAWWGESQNLGIAIMTDYDFSQYPNVRCKATFGLNSTDRDIPSIDALFDHSQNEKKFDTNIVIKHTNKTALNGQETVNYLGIKSNWQLHSNSAYRNISGSIVLKSPFEGYKTGSLATKFVLSSEKEIEGAAELVLESKKYSLSLEGVVRKITDSMLTANITTPIERFSNIVGRFGINEKNRHLVAEVRAPAGALGIEIMLAFIKMGDFNVKFNLETPIESLQKIMIIGKMKPDVIDFRGGFNKLIAGYVGVTRIVAMTDFELSYKLFTPFEKFEENGIVVKFIKNEEIFDLEATLKFAQKKLGL